MTIQKYSRIVRLSFSAETAPVVHGKDEQVWDSYPIIVKPELGNIMMKII
jgi:hypothetical protein